MPRKKFQTRLPKKLYECRCERCGKRFTATRSDARFDSPACRKYASRAAQAAHGPERH